MKAHFILYVSDQIGSTVFYSQVLDAEPILNVPGMTEFLLSDDCVLGLMPEEGAQRLLGERVNISGPVGRQSRAEVYIVVDNAEAYHRRALAAGAVELRKLEDQDWGHRTAYSMDLDGHVLAFAEPL